MGVGGGEGRSGQICRRLWGVVWADLGETRGIHKIIEEV